MLPSKSVTIFIILSNHRLTTSADQLFTVAIELNMYKPIYELSRRGYQMHYDCDPSLL